MQYFIVIIVHGNKKQVVVSTDCMYHLTLIVRYNSDRLIDFDSMFIFF